MGKYCRQHIGKTFNDGKLIVVDGSDKRHYVKVKCRVCTEDSELFGDGVFEAPFVNINYEFSFDDPQYAKHGMTREQWVKTILVPLALQLP